uniref:Uncharacterized protein n=1 Tax=Ditylenchus dipsaci TaxID=166011 RepID=A0A915D051_9BILA
MHCFTIFSCITFVFIVLPICDTTTKTPAHNDIPSKPHTLPHSPSSLTRSNSVKHIEEHKSHHDSPTPTHSSTLLRSSSSSLKRSNSIKHKEENDHSSEHHFSFRKFFRNIDDKVKAFWKGLPDQLGYDFVMELIENKFEDIEAHFKNNKSSRRRREAIEIEDMFATIKDTTKEMKQKVEEMEKTNPELLVKSSKDNLAKSETEELLQSAITSLEPKTNVPQNNNLISIGTFDQHNVISDEFTRLRFFKITLTSFWLIT